MGGVYITYFMSVFKGYNCYFIGCHPIVFYNRDPFKIRPNTTKFYVLSRTTCFDLFQVIFRFTISV
jgi:hypothetical protein